MTGISKMSARTTSAIVGASTKACLSTRPAARKPLCNRRIGYARSNTLPRTGATTPVHRMTTINRSNVAICAARDDAKVALMAELDGAQSRAVLAELVIALEAENPTESPTSSELLAGQWKFAYSGGVAPGLVPSPTRPIALAMYAGGFTPGTLGLSVAEMLPNELVKTRGFRMKIEQGEKGFTSTATVNVDLLGRSFVAQVNCDLVPESGIRLLETYKSPSELQYQRLMFITYLDKDMMIARDETGCPDIMRRSTFGQGSDTTSSGMEEAAEKLLPSMDSPEQKAKPASENLEQDETPMISLEVDEK